MKKLENSGIVNVEIPYMALLHVSTRTEEPVYISFCNINRADISEGCVQFNFIY